MKLIYIPKKKDAILYVFYCVIVAIVCWIFAKCDCGDGNANDEISVPEQTEVESVSAEK